MEEVCRQVQKLVISFILADRPLERKRDVLVRSITLLKDISEPEADKLDSILRWYDKTGEFPTKEYFSLNLGIVPDVDVAQDLNMADIANALERVLNDVSRKRVAEICLDIAKNKDKLSKKDILSRLSQASDLVEVKSADTVFSIRDQYDKMKTMPLGCLTFINPVDKEIGAVRKGTMMTIAGFAKCFKTTTGISILYGNAIELNQNGVFISLEMPKELIWYYLLARHSYHQDFANIGDPVDKKSLIHATLTPEQEKFIFEVVEPDLKKRKGKIVVLDATDFDSMSFSGIRTRLSRIPHDIDFCITDYAQCFRYFKEARELNSKDPENLYISFFKGLAIDFNGYPTSQIMLAQTNRSGYTYASEHDGEYQMTAVAELNSLERDSACMIFLYSDDDLKESQELKVNLPANRFGASFQSPITTFVDPAYNVVGDFVSGAGSSSGDVDFVSTLLEDLSL